MHINNPRDCLCIGVISNGFMGYDDNIVCPSSLVIYLIPGMREKHCTENCHKMSIFIGESTGLFPWGYELTGLCLV